MEKNGIIYDKVHLSGSDDYWVVRKCKSCDPVIVVEACLDGLPVKHIMAYAFKNNTTVKDISIPDTIELIGKFAFCGCRNLKRVVIAGTYEDTKEEYLTLRDSCFKDCRNLFSIIGDKIVEFDGSNVFYGCENLMFFGYNNKIVGNLPPSVFHNCSKLESFHLIDRNCYFATNCIHGCMNLKIIRIDCKNITMAKQVLPLLAKKHIICKPNCNLIELAYSGTQITVD